MDLSKRGTGKTTRLLIELMHDSIHNNSIKRYVVVCGTTKAQVEVNARKLAKAFNHFGISTRSLTPSMFSYVHKWNGKPQFDREFEFLTVDEYKTRTHGGRPFALESVWVDEGYLEGF